MVNGTDQLFGPFDSCTHSINPFLPPYPSPASALRPTACWPRSALTETSRMDRCAKEEREVCDKRTATRFVRPLLHLRNKGAPTTVRGARFLAAQPCPHLPSSSHARRSTSFRQTRWPWTRLSRVWKCAKYPVLER